MNQEIKRSTAHINADAMRDNAQTITEALGSEVYSVIDDIWGLDSDRAVTDESTTITLLPHWDTLDLHAGQNRSDFGRRMSIEELALLAYHIRRRR